MEDCDLTDAPSYVSDIRFPGTRCREVRGDIVSDRIATGSILSVFIDTHFPGALWREVRGSIVSDCKSTGSMLGASIAYGVGWPMVDMPSTRSLLLVPSDCEPSPTITLMIWVQRRRWFSEYCLLRWE